MDARLWSINGLRAETLKNSDVPALAKAIVAYMRHLEITVRAGFVRNVSYVLFQGDRNNFQVLVRGEDWAKILPYLKDDFLSPSAQSPKLPWWNGSASLANIDTFDPIYYQRVLSLLNRLFPEPYPTSYL